MTPSGWHDDTRSRDAGHDEMQLAVLRKLKSREPEPIPGRFNEVYKFRGVYAEFPFYLNGQIIAFADVCEVFRTDKAGYGGYYELFYVAYEIKPRILSVGGVIRQALALDSAIERAKQGRQSTANQCRVIPVVPAHDPKIDLLREMYNGSIWAWGSSRIVMEGAA